MQNIHYVPFTQDDSPVLGGEAGGDGFKSVLGVVVSLMIPVAAPAIAGALGTSLGLSAITSGGIMGAVGNTLVGAAMGAGSAALQGGNIGTGALQGAFSGFTGGGGFGARPQAGGAGNVANAGKAGLATAGKSTFATTAPSAGLTMPGSTGVTMTGVAGNKPLLAQLGSPSSAANLANPAVPAGQGVMDALRSIPANIVKQMGGVDQLIPAITRMALQGVVGDPYMQAAIDARRAEIEAAQQANERLYEHRLNVSNRILNEADYYNPQQGGTEAVADYTARVNNAEDEALRDLAVRNGYNTGRRDTIRRQAGLARGRGAASAYLEGANNAELRRGQRRNEALSWLPTQAPNSSAAAQNQLDELQRRARGDEIEEWMGLAGGVFGAKPHQPNEEEQWPQAGLDTGWR